MRRAIRGGGPTPRAWPELDLTRFRFKGRCAIAISERLDFMLTMLRATGPLSRRFPPWPSDGTDQDERALPQLPVKVCPQSFRQARIISFLSPESLCRYGREQPQRAPDPPHQPGSPLRPGGCEPAGRAAHRWARRSGHHRAICGAEPGGAEAADRAHLMGAVRSLLIPSSKTHVATQSSSL